MRHSIAILSFLAGAAYADDVLSFIFPGGIDGPAPVATVVSANPSTTSAVMTCPTGTPADECGFAMGLDVEIIGGTRYQASMSAAGVTVSYGCDGYDASAMTMTCTAEMSGQDTQTAVLSGTDVNFITASVVEGASLLSGGAATASASATAASASASASASVTPKTSAASSGMQTSASASGTTAHTGSHASGAASATGSGAASTSTGAAARFGIEGAALLALAGAAAANVF